MLGHRLDLDPYADGDSLVHRWDPRLKIVAAALLACAITLARSLPVVAAELGFVLVLLVLSRLPARFVVRRLTRFNSFLIPFLIVVPILSEGTPLAKLGPLTIKDKGLELGLAMYGKALALVTLAMVVLNTARLTDTLWAMGFIGVPRALRQLALVTVRYLPIATEELQAVRIAAASRGFRFAANARTVAVASNMASGIVGRSVRRSDRIWSAMLCRGFRGRFYTVRKWKLKAFDWAALALTSVLCALFVLLDFFLHGK